MIELTREQKKVVKTFSKLPSGRSLLLVAGAGTGKTSTLLAVLKDTLCRTPASKIALLSFSRQSAIELKERSNLTELGFCGTLHSLAFKMIQEKHFVKVIDNPGAIKLSILNDLYPGKYSMLKESDSFFSILSKEDYDTYSLQYQRYKRTRSLYDYDDLIAEAARLRLGESKFDCFLIDEFQDLSATQLAWLKSLKFKKLFAVGDDWQSIYGFRNASLSNILDFSSHFPRAHQLCLTKNFRSHRQITKLGNSVIKNCQKRTKKKLVSKKIWGPKPTLLAYKNNDRVLTINKVWSYLNLKFPGENFQWLTRTNHLRTEIQFATSGQVNAMTIHSAKGLEFKNVLLYTLEKSEFPNARADINEEVRLFYVAVTRVQEKLIVCGNYANKKSPFFGYLAGHAILRQIA